jgi:hypothetical protein
MSGVVWVSGRFSLVSQQHKNKFMSGRGLIQPWYTPIPRAEARVGGLLPLFGPFLSLKVLRGDVNVALESDLLRVFGKR